MKPSVTVVIPTTGADTLKRCVLSVVNQTYDNVKPYVVIDGNEFSDACTVLWDIEDDYRTYDIPYCMLPYNVGKNGWYGHRIFAAFSYLVNTDYVCFLDQDNWFEPNHIESLVKVAHEHTWAFSLRNIVDKSGDFICHDECESLGPSTKHIDTSCYMVPTNVLTQGIAAAWYGQWGADRQFYHHLRTNFPDHRCTNEYTVNYRLGGNEGSVTADFFLQGNKYKDEQANKTITIKIG